MFAANVVPLNLTADVLEAIGFETQVNGAPFRPVVPCTYNTTARVRGGELVVPVAPHLWAVVRFVWPGAGGGGIRCICKDAAPSLSAIPERQPQSLPPPPRPTSTPCSFAVLLPLCTLLLSPQLMRSAAAAAAPCSTHCNATYCEYFHPVISPGRYQLTVRVTLYGKEGTSTASETWDFVVCNSSSYASLSVTGELTCLSW